MTVNKSRILLDNALRPTLNLHRGLFAAEIGC